MITRNLIIVSRFRLDALILFKVRLHATTVIPKDIYTSTTCTAVCACSQRYYVGITSCPVSLHLVPSHTLPPPFLQPALQKVHTKHSGDVVGQTGCVCVCVHVCTTRQTASKLMNRQHTAPIILLSMYVLCCTCMW